MKEACGSHVPLRHAQHFEEVTSNRGPISGVVRLQSRNLCQPLDSVVLFPGTFLQLPELPRRHENQLRESLPEKVRKHTLTGLGSNLFVDIRVDLHSCEVASAREDNATGAPEDLPASMFSQRPSSLSTCKLRSRPSAESCTCQGQTARRLKGASSRNTARQETEPAPQVAAGSLATVHPQTALALAWSPRTPEAAHTANTGHQAGYRPQMRRPHSMLCRSLHHAPHFSPKIIVQEEISQTDPAKHFPVLGVTSARGSLSCMNPVT